MLQALHLQGCCLQERKGFNLCTRYEVNKIYNKFCAIIHYITALCCFLPHNVWTNPLTIIIVQEREDMTGNRKVLEDRPNQSSERRPSRPRKLPSSKNFHFSIIPRVFSLAQAYNISQTILFPFFGKNKNYNKIINIDWNALELRPRD